MRVIIITGLSGSGKSTAARALEDDGFFVVDNLPQTLLLPFLAMGEGALEQRQDLAVVIDARSRAYLKGLEENLAAIRAAGHRLEVFFFDADDETLGRRYSETRRRHPLALEEGVPEGIRRERQLLTALRNLATVLVETTGLSPHQLRAQVVKLVRGGNEADPLLVHLQSFGFRYGLPPSADLVIDVRFLPNPHFLPELRASSGLDVAVRDYVLTQPLCREFMKKFENLLEFLLPQYRHEGKSYLTIAVGCTGGRHRSVAVVEALATFLTARGFLLKTLHRDIDKG